LNEQVKVANYLKGNRFTLNTYNKVKPPFKIALLTAGFPKTLSLKPIFWGLKHLAYTGLFLFLCALFLTSCTAPQGHSSYGYGQASVSLKLSAWGSQQELTLLKRQLQRFENTHPNVHVTLLHSPENYFQKLHLQLAAGLVSDVMMVNSLAYGRFARYGYLQDLNPLLKQETSSGLPAKAFYPVALKAFQFVSTRHPQPIQAALPRDISNVVMYYNKSLLKQLHLPEPSPHWGWQECLALSKEVVARSQKQAPKAAKTYGVSFYRSPPLFWLPFVWSWGGVLLDERWQHLQLNEPKALAGLRFYQDLAFKHHVAPTRNDLGNLPMTQLFLQQRLAFMVSGRWSVPFLREFAKFDWDVAPFPGPAGSRVGVDASGYGLSAKSEHPREAWALLKFLASAPQLQEVSDSGLIVPSLQAVAQSDRFLSPALKPAHSQVFLQSLSTGVASQSPPAWLELTDQLGVTLEPVWDGKADPEPVLKQAEAKLNSLLQ
jgi:multiple sugar transport system substrate-binding protein